MNKKATIVIDREGNYTMELKEGFSGKSCIEAANQLKIIVGGGIDKESKEKPEYYEPEQDNLNTIFNK